MRKERSERYRSASALADDIENYLTGVPLIAGPPDAAYKLKKFIRRNRILVSCIAVVILVLIAGIVVSTVFAIKAERARSREQEVSDYLMKSIMDTGRDGALLERTWEDFLENAVKGLEGKFQDQPLVEAKLRYSLAHKHNEAFKHETARELLERAYQIRAQHLGPENEQTLHTAMILGWAHSLAGRHDVAIEMWNDQIETFRTSYGDEHWRIMLLKTSIAKVYGTLGNYKEQEVCLDEALERWEPLRDRPAFRFRLFDIQKEMGGNYLAQGRYVEAEQALCKALEMKFPFNVSTLGCRRILSAVYRAQGRYVEAQQLCQTTMDTMIEELGEDHWATLKTKCELGCILMDQDRLHEAEKLISEALRIMRLKRGNANENALPLINTLAVVYTKQGAYTDANDLFIEALKGRRQTLGENHPKTLKTINDFGVLRRKQKKYPEAEKLLRQALDGRQRKLGRDHPAYFESMHELAVLYKEQESYEEAEKYLLEAVEGRRLKLGDKHPHTIESIRSLITLYEAWNKPEKAEKWRAELPQMEAMTE
jgi:tetratricopeptide (TPR) repeat protein